MRAKRQAWPGVMAGVDGSRLVFLDETWASTAMTRPYGRCPVGERLVMAVPCGHWKTTTFVAALLEAADEGRADGVLLGQLTGLKSRVGVGQDALAQVDGIRLHDGSSRLVAITLPD